VLPSPRHEEEIIIGDLYEQTVDASVNIAKESVNTRLVLPLTRGRCILSQHACRTLPLNSIDLLTRFVVFLERLALTDYIM